MTDFLLNNWQIIIIVTAIISVCGYFIYLFIKTPTSEQVEKIQEWLLYAVAEAEKEFGGGTGELKLSYVYNLFVRTFPSLSKVITFDCFSVLVEFALEKLDTLLENNDNYINIFNQNKTLGS